jgi:hypothetical protein
MDLFSGFKFTFLKIHDEVLNREIFSRFHAFEPPSKLYLKKIQTLYHILIVVDTKLVKAVIRLTFYADKKYKLHSQLKHQTMEFTENFKISSKFFHCFII